MPEYVQAARRGRRLWADDAGLSTVEYVIILVLLAAIALATWSVFGQRIKDQIGIAGEQLDLLGELASAEDAPGLPTETHRSASSNASPTLVSGTGAPSTAASATGTPTATPTLAAASTPASATGTPTATPTLAAATGAAPPASASDRGSLSPEATAALVAASNAPPLAAGLAPPVPDPGRGATEVTTPLSTAPPALPTQAQYAVGPATRPDIFQDNGHLQNPNDPNDRTPQPTQDPTLSDRFDYAKQSALATAGIAATQVGWPEWATPDQYAQFLDTPDGVLAYDHFLHGQGADRTIPLEKFVAEDPSGKTALRNSTRDTQRGAEELYAQMLQNDPSLAGQTVTFDMTGTPVVAGASTQYPYPDSENWQKALGGYQTWNSATVTVTPSPVAGDPPNFSMDYSMHVEDRYNFDPGKSDVATKQPDAVNGRFETTGLAHQYTNLGTLGRDVTWEQGDIAGATVSDPGGR